MTRSLTRLLLWGALGTLALAVAACGSSKNSSSSSGGSASAPSTKSGTGKGPGQGVIGKCPKKGGVLTQLGSSDVDYLDPGHTYFTQGYQVAYPTQRPLYSFNPSDSSKPVPDLADGDPTVSADQKTVTIKIKSGVKFSPPVNRAVTSADVKYAIERSFSANVGGEYATAYFGDIVGAPAKPTTGVKPISGITTPDPQTLVLHFNKPSAPAVVPALVMPITMPVPESYAKPFDAKNPSTYNTHVVATGPYMVKNNAAGSTIGYDPGKSIDLVRNPNWDASTDYKPACLDEIKMVTNRADADVASQQVLKGSAQVLDTNPPSATLQQVVTQIKDQYLQLPGGGYRYFPMDTKIKPFNNINVRKAVIASFDRTAALKARGGKFSGDIPTHFLPPGLPGFDEAGGFNGPGFDFLKSPSGDPTVAAAYMKKAGYPSGKYTGGGTFLVVGSNADPGKSQAQVAKTELEKLGFKINLRLVPQDALYTQYCQVPAKKVAVCGGAGWFKDFQDPQSMLQPVFEGKLITATGNNNMAQLDDPAVDAAMDKATFLSGEDRLKAWANIDKMITNDAPAIPFDWDKTTLIRSKDVNGVGNGYYDAWDFAFTSLK